MFNRIYINIHKPKKIIMFREKKLKRVLGNLNKKKELLDLVSIKTLIYNNNKMHKMIINNKIPKVMINNKMPKILINNKMINNKIIKGK